MDLRTGLERSLSSKEGKEYHFVSISLFLKVIDPEKSLDQKTIKNLYVDHEK